MHVNGGVLSGYLKDNPQQQQNLKAFGKEMFTKFTVRK